MPRHIEKKLMPAHNDRVVFKKQCKYIGSVAITLLNGEEKQKFVNEKLLEMKDVGKGVSVVLVITDEGVKVMTETESAIKMAHGITRIAFSTCQPDRKLFAYVAKSTVADKSVLIQAHMFKTKKNSDSQRLSTSLSKAFKMAYDKDSVRRKNRVKLFEIEAEMNKAKENKGRKWAKVEMAHGHEYSSHALQAKGKYSSPHVNKVMKEIGKDIDREVANDNSHGSKQKNDEVNINSENGVSAKPSRLKGADIVKIKSVSENCDKSQQNEFVMVNSAEEEKERKTSGNLKIVTPTSKFSDVQDVHVIKSSHDTHDDATETLKSYENVVLDKHGSYHIVNDIFVDDQQHDAVPELPLRQKDEKSNNEITHARMNLNRLTMTEEEILKDSEWYQPGFSRDIAEQVLQNRSIGSFFIRDSASQVGSFVMTVKVPAHMKSKGVANFLIEQLEDSYFRIRGFPSTFPALTDLVAHYGSVQEDIPCQLRLANDNPLFLRKLHIDQPDGVPLKYSDDSDSDEYDDPDYELYNTTDDIMEELEKLTNEN